MSTKSTISHGQNYHLYQEIFDVSHVYLRVEGHEFDVSRDGAMIQIPIEAWRTMIKDWKSRGWPESEDHTEKEIGEEWLKSLEENPIFKKRRENEED
jgi:hypothetical protein